MLFIQDVTMHSFNPEWVQQIVPIMAESPIGKTGSRDTHIGSHNPLDNIPRCSPSPLQARPPLSTRVTSGTSALLREHCFILADRYRTTLTATPPPPTASQ